MTVNMISYGNSGRFASWEARQKGEEPVVKELPVSCLTPKYREPEWVAIIYVNQSVFHLPGQGVITNDKCGQWVHPLSCPDYENNQTTLDGSHAHDRFVVQHSCHKPDCPVCYESWAFRQAVNTSDRLIQGVNLYRKAGYEIEYETSFGLRHAKIGRLDHVVFSPPQDLAKLLIRTSEGAKTLRAKAITVMKKAGMLGGALIFHPFRQNDSRENNFNPDLPEGVWYESPHFHVVGCGYLKKSDEFYDLTGWTYKKMGRRESIQGTIKYTLTHCGVSEGFQAITYFGLFSNNKIVIDKIEKVTESIKCRCGKELHKFALIENDSGELEVDWKQGLGVYLHVVIKKTYKLRMKHPCFSVGGEI